MQKREHFAVNLRKNKKQSLLKTKRKKIADKNHQVKSESKDEYTGYPPWRDKGIDALNQLLTKYHPQQYWDDLSQKGKEIELINVILKIMEEYAAQNSEIDNLALMTKIRMVFC